MAAEPKKFRWAKTLGEAVGDHVMGTDMLRVDLFCFVEEANIVRFECDVS